MKTLYFVQHGAALSKDVDAKRPLSNTGSEQVKRAAAYLKAHNVIIRKICHSGKLRAAQTAALFSEILAVEQVSELSGMNPNDNPSELIKQISEDAVMYIGHLPHIQKAAAGVITNNSEHPLLKFQNSAVVCIELDKGVGCIKWFITPDMC
ncbi:phosphohistidine phosphatase SixA [Psychromonas aquimarina]|uniref:phosphohistidine phosphatase SixA n=1 Tax=Psychromonas aquimarina TaxID=444919 RepID=UPI000405113C|nr:phosphohistidine phosphatase SixA [Psychromonas aquimarina]